MPRWTSLSHGKGDKALRIGVDFHVFDGKFQGSRSHLFGLYSELVCSYPQHRYFFFLQEVKRLASLPAFNRDNVTLVEMPTRGSLTRLLWQLPRLSGKYQLDLLHSQYVAPLWPRHGHVITVHDILYEPYPQYFPRLFVLRSRWLTRWSARRADHLLTVSEYCRAELSRRYEIDAGRVAVTGNAVDTERFRPGAAGADIIRDRGLVSGDFILSVGRIEPRKNYPSLLRAYGRMAGRVPPLVIVGQRDFHHAAFDAALAALPPTCRVRVLSDVSDQELPALYRHALAFAYPSFAEGFGMPLLEAMASGTPLVSSASTAIPEVVGDAGLLIDSANEGQLCDALERLCSDLSLRQRLIAAGLERAAGFTWRRSAQDFARACLTEPL